VCFYPDPVPSGWGNAESSVEFGLSIVIVVVFASTGRSIDDSPTPSYGLGMWYTRPAAPIPHYIEPVVCPLLDVSLAPRMLAFVQDLDRKSTLDLSLESTGADLHASAVTSNGQVTVPPCSSSLLDVLPLSRISPFEPYVPLGVANPSPRTRR